MLSASRRPGRLAADESTDSGSGRRVGWRGHDARCSEREWGLVKVVFLLKFRPERDPDGVRRWWREDHGSLALATMPGLLRYVQNHFVRPVEAEHAAGGMPFDGIAEVWFESREAYEAAVASAQGQAVLADGAVGFEPDSGQAGFVAEHVLCWDALPDGRVYTTAGTLPDA